MILFQFTCCWFWSCMHIIHVHSLIISYQQMLIIKITQNVYLRFSPNSCFISDYYHLFAFFNSLIFLTHLRLLWVSLYAIRHVHETAFLNWKISHEIFYPNVRKTLLHANNFFSIRLTLIVSPTKITGPIFLV